MTEPNSDMPDAIAHPEADAPDVKPHPGTHGSRGRPAPQTAGFGSPRDLLDNQFIYLTISARARGLAVGVNVNPDKLCNFDCVYCNIDRHPPVPKVTLDVKAMSEELQRTLTLVQSGQIRRQPMYTTLPDELLQLRHVALSGDGEPTLCPNFADAVQSVVHVRACGRFPFFKIVLVTNGTGLDLPPVWQSLKLFTDSDEIWVKLDAGTQAFSERINRPQVPLKKVLSNILALGRQRPVVIQSMFLTYDGQEPSDSEIEEYVDRLKELKKGGAAISLVQVYSPTRPMAEAGCGNLPLKSLSRIAKLIRSGSGLRAEVF